MKCQMDSRLIAKYVVIISILCAYVFAAHLKERLEEYIKQWNGLVKLFRNEKREGLIQARSIGAKKATKGQVSYDLTASAPTIATVTSVLVFISSFTYLISNTLSFVGSRCETF